MDEYRWNLCSVTVETGCKPHHIPYVFLKTGHFVYSEYVRCGLRPVLYHTVIQIQAISCQCIKLFFFFFFFDQSQCFKLLTY